MEKKGYSRLDLEKRGVIEGGLNDDSTLTAIAGRIGVDVSTVRREILRNRRADGPSSSSNRDKNNCAFNHSCKVKHLCDRPLGCNLLCRNCVKMCENMCDQYVEKTCRRTDGAPFVCNACQRYTFCTMPRYKYSAEAAQKASEERWRDPRCGIDLTPEEVGSLVAVVKAGRAKGQSVHHIFATNDMPCSERSFYRYVEEGSIPVMPLDLAKKVKYKKRRRKKQVSAHEKGFYKGCEYADYMKLPAEERATATEVDTVLGRKRDGKCILSLHRVDLRFQIYLLLDKKSPSCVVRALDHLEMCCEGRFEEFFGLTLFDRGSEFDDIAGMQRSFLHSGSRARVFFADPSRPDQKGGCEKNHVELRKVVPKGTSLDSLDPWTLSEICCHVDSTARKGCGDVSPMQLAELVFPREMMDNLGLRLIPAGDVVSAPGILYKPAD